jgi:hypothetical protein
MCGWQGSLGACYRVTLGRQPGFGGLQQPPKIHPVSSKSIEAIVSTLREHVQ